jgi:AsmA protein
MKHKIFISATVLVASFFLATMALPYMVNVDGLRPLLESYLESSLGRKVAIGELSLALFSGGVSAKSVAIADDQGFSDKPFARAKSIKVGVSLFPLLVGHSLRVTSLTLEDPEITLLRSSAGKWNFSSIGDSSAAAQPIGSDTASTTSSWILDKVWTR